MCMTFGFHFRPLAETESSKIIQSYNNYLGVKKAGNKSRKYGWECLLERVTHSSHSMELSWSLTFTLQ